jgi:membrane fusion protein (multidrug efflux system)
MKFFTALVFLTVTAPAMAEDYACLIEPMQTLKLAAPVQGVVEKVNVDRGDRVTKGQVVASLESDVEEDNVLIARAHAANDSAVASAHAKLDFLRRKVDRNERLRATNFVSALQMEEAASDAKIAVAQLREAEMNVVQAKLEAARTEGLLRQRRVVSPVDGIVTERTLGPGEFRNDQAHILTVAQVNPLRVETFLPIALFRSVKIGDLAEIRPDEPVGGTFTAKVTVVDHVFDAASNTVGVRLELPNPDMALPAGIHCRVRFSAIP